MVAKLTEQEKQKISSAIMEAEKLTGAEIAVAVTNASDGYISFAIVIGFMLGSLLSCGVWFFSAITSFPHLFFIQLSSICIFSFVPFLRNACLLIIPKNMKHHRASQRAYAEYMAVSRSVPAEVPVILLYISLAEHYAHIIPGRLINEKIAGKNWDNVINEFTAEIQPASLCDSCINAIRKISTLLEQDFPASKSPNYISDHVIETK